MIRIKRVIKPNFGHAFTLAEVLITLGVIGIVAAMTLPALSKKIEKTVLKSEIKKAYSTLAQAQQKALFECGDVFVFRNNMNYLAFNEAVVKNLKIMSTCNGNALAKGCIKEYQGLNRSGCSGFWENNIYNNATVYVLEDGTFVIPYNMNWRSLWLVDVNGKKGPNKAGYDLFQITMDQSDLILRMTEDNMDCLNQDRVIKGGLDDYRNIDRWR